MPRSGSAPSDLDSGPTATLSGGGFEIGAEEMTLDLRLRGLSIGRLRVAVGEPGEVSSRRAIIIRSIVDSAGFLSLVKDLTWELQTTVDLERGYPIEESSSYAVRIDGTDESGADSRSYGATESLHNFHSLAMAVRGWNPVAGDRVELRARVMGRFRVTMRMIRRRYDRTFGRPVVRIDGVAHFGGGHRFSVLVTDDASRVPLRVDVDSRLGRFSAVLVRYRGPRWQFPPRRHLHGVISG